MHLARTAFTTTFPVPWSPPHVSSTIGEKSTPIPGRGGGGGRGLGDMKKGENRPCGAQNDPNNGGSNRPGIDCTENTVWREVRRSEPIHK